MQWKKLVPTGGRGHLHSRDLATVRLQFFRNIP